ncbi:deoxyribonuclease, partial [Bifidobacterium pseudolongum subsp. globosum]|uniref:GmrSD restriction endonuclease domain-containing protein n=1 Tax=Bifidobacterium pseudolongum TaxID=1694 RepID=UPI0010E34CEA
PSANPTTQTPPPDTTTQPTPNTSGLPAAAASPISIADALTTAQAMPTAKPHTTGYKANRDTLFGGWANSPQLCGTATMRDQILKRDLTNPVLNSQCQVTSGTFTDPYTGQHMTFKRGKDTSSLIQIDHVVAVYDAYASGLWNRSQQERETYANDPDVLLASQGKANMVKSEGINLNGKGGRNGWTQSTPSIWLPDNRGYQCDYMAKRVHIKHKYNLTMSAWEKDETIAFLTQCATQ